MNSGVQIVAMHGWCGDRRSWDPWLAGWESRGWRSCCGERGYGEAEPITPAWDGEAGLRLVIAHSLGPHLLPAALLAEADAVVLLTSFSRFVPEGRAGRAVRAALDAMARDLGGSEPQRMLRTFLAQVASPESAASLQATPADGALNASGLQRLIDDLMLIASSSDLPAGFPRQAPVLLVQAAADQIVAPEARQALQERLPQADVLTLAHAGHGLINTPVMGLVNAWIEGLRPA